MAAGEPQVPITWDLIRKRNFVERLKAEKGGLAVIDDLPAMIETGYEAVPEEDFVRMQWYGLYHDKPKLGYFMLRVKLQGGLLTPAKLRTIGEISQRFGRGYGELTTRQNIQLHWIELAHLPEILRILQDGGMTTGVISALEAAGYAPGDVPLIAMGSNQVLYDAMADGWLSASSTQDPSAEGALAVEVLYGVLEGTAEPGWTKLPTPVAYPDTADNFAWF
jgi:hypothetical protein